MIKIFRNSIIALILFIILLICISFFVRVNKIEVNGKDEAYEEFITEKIFEHSFDRISLLLFIRTNFFNYNYNIPHVKKIKTKFVSPVHVVFDITEKDLIGYAKNISGYYYFDEDLYISERDNKIYENTIEVTGLSSYNFEVGDYLPENAYKLNLPYIIKSITYILINRGLYIDSIIIYNQERISIVKGKIEANLGDDKYVEEKLNLFYSMYDNIKDMSGIVDLSTVKTKDDKGEYIFKKR